MKIIIKNEKKASELPMQTIVVFIILIIVLIVIIMFFSEHFSSNQNTLVNVGNSSINEAQNYLK